MRGTLFLFLPNEQAVESERLSLSEALEASQRSRAEADKAAKKASDDLRILTSKHERLLQAQRAANLHAAYDPNPPSGKTTYGNSNYGGHSGGDYNYQSSQFPLPSPSRQLAASSGRSAHTAAHNGGGGRKRGLLALTTEDDQFVTDAFDYDIVEDGTQVFKFARVLYGLLC